MKLKILLIVSYAVIMACIASLTSCSDTAAATLRPPTAADTDRPTDWVLDSLTAVYEAKIAAMEAAAHRRVIDTENNYQAAMEPTAQAAATVCPTTYTPKKGAQAGEPQPVLKGSRGGCYYLNAAGNKSYLKK